VGLIPLVAVLVLEQEQLDRLPRFQRRVEWFLQYRPYLMSHIAPLNEDGIHGRYQLAVLSREKLARVLARVFDPDEFLSPYGLRSLSRFHALRPFSCYVGGQSYSVSYEPAESNTDLFGGNSNWRGPIWFPINYLIIESLLKFHHYYGDEFKVEYPTGSGQFSTLLEVAERLSERLVRIFQLDENNERPVYRHCQLMQRDRHFRDHLLFYEYFHGDSGRGVGASHQTGWTALVAKLLQPRRTLN
jgi:hypothetical protein